MNDRLLTRMVPQSAALSCASFFSGARSAKLSCIEGGFMDEGLMYDLCSRARRVQFRSGGSEASLQGLTDLIRAATDPGGRRSDLELQQMIESAPQPVGYKYSLKQLESLSASKSAAPGQFTEEEAEEHADAQAALLRAIGKDSGEPVSGPVGVAKNVLEQLFFRWF